MARVRLQQEPGPFACSRTVLSAGARSWRYGRLWLLLMSLLLGVTLPAFAQVSREYQLKAVFLWRLAQFTQWPAEAFETAESPISICVLGENPFGDALQAAVRGETAHGRSLMVRHIRTIQETKACHVLYISDSMTRQIKEIVAATAWRSILTVKDGEASPRTYNAMVRFVTDQNKIRLLVHLKAVTAAGLVVDPRLLRAAEVVESE